MVNSVVVVMVVFEVAATMNNVNFDGFVLVFVFFVLHADMIWLIYNHQHGIFSGGLHFVVVTGGHE